MEQKSPPFGQRLHRMTLQCLFCGLDDTTKAGKKKNKLVTKQMYKNFLTKFSYVQLTGKAPGLIIKQ